MWFQLRQVPRETKSWPRAAQGEEDWLQPGTRSLQGAGVLTQSQTGVMAAQVYEITKNSTAQ